MSDPAPRIPRYARNENWKPGEEEVERSFQPSGEDVLLRAASVAPFVLVAAFGVIAVVGWIIVVVFGVSAPGNPGTEPIWRWARGEPPAHVVSQVLLAIGIGLIPVAVVGVASWAVVHGFRERPHPLFWPAAELFWGIVAIAMVVADRGFHGSLTQLGFGSLDWWFLFLMVAAALILAGVRQRRLRRRPGV